MTTTKKKINVMSRLAELTAEVNRCELELGELAQQEQIKLAEAAQAREAVEKAWAVPKPDHDRIAEMANTVTTLESAIREGRDGPEHIAVQAKMATVKQARNEAMLTLKAFSEEHATVIEASLVEDAIQRFDRIHEALVTFWAEVKQSAITGARWDEFWRSLALTRNPARLPPSAAEVFSSVKPGSWDPSRLMPAAPTDLLADEEVIAHMRERGHDRLAGDLERKLAQKRSAEEYLRRRQEREAEREHERV